MSALVGRECSAPFGRITAGRNNYSWGYRPGFFLAQRTLLGPARCQHFPQQRAARLKPERAFLRENCADILNEQYPPA